MKAKTTTEENFWNYLKAKLYVKGIKDNNLTAKHIFNQVTKYFKPAKND